MMRLSPEFFRFVLAGAINTGTTYILFLISLLVFPYLLAYTISYAAGIGMSFFLNSHVVFRQPARSPVAYIRFAVVYAAQYAANATLLWFLVDRLDFPPAAGMILVVAISVPLTFLALRRVFNG
jgi:putative flippase GtrA